MMKAGAGFFRSRDWRVSSWSILREVFSKVVYPLACLAVLD